MRHTLVLVLLRLCISRLMLRVMFAPLGREEEATSEFIFESLGPCLCLVCVVVSEFDLHEMTLAEVQNNL